MKDQLKSLVRTAVNRLGYNIVPLARDASGEPVQAALHYNVDPGFAELSRRVQPYTMTSPERQHALYQAVEYLERARIPGAIVECGVWRGGSSMLACLALARLGAERDVFLFDTYSGMTPPTAADVDRAGEGADKLLAIAPKDTSAQSIWCIASLDDVKSNLRSTGYPEHRLHFVKGKVEDTVPAQSPAQIALLRLDTDWYESTRHELVHLLPRVADGGVLIVDDYGHWQGARRAVDEILAMRTPTILLHRIDDTGRIGIVRRSPIADERA